MLLRGDEITAPISPVRRRDDNTRNDIITTPSARQTEHALETLFEKADVSPPRDRLSYIRPGATSFRSDRSSPSAASTPPPSRDYINDLLRRARVDLPTPTRPVRTTRPLSSTRRASERRRRRRRKRGTALTHRHRLHRPRRTPPHPTQHHHCPSQDSGRALTPSIPSRRRVAVAVPRASAPARRPSRAMGRHPSRPLHRRSDALNTTFTPMYHHTHAVPPHGAYNTRPRASRVPVPSPRLGSSPTVHPDPIDESSSSGPSSSHPPRAPSRHGDDDESVRDGRERASRPVLRDDDDENARGWRWRG